MSGFMDECIKGVLALFKGMSTPLASAALVNAISFGAYAQSQRVSCFRVVLCRCIVARTGLWSCVVVVAVAVASITDVAVSGAVAVATVAAVPATSVVNLFAIVLDSLLLLRLSVGVGTGATVFPT